MNDDLIAFLRARLDETERIARATWPEPIPRVTDPDDLRNPWEDPYGEIQSRDSAAFEHIRANDPARVLRQVEAHREILEWVLERQVPHSTVGDEFWFPVAAIARIWSDHDQFREEWRA